MFKYFLLLISLLNLGNAFSSVNNLKYSLLMNYDRDNIPKQNGPMNLTLEMVLSSVNNIDHLDGIISYNLWLRYYWNDYRLRWNQSTYNVSQITFNSDPLYETSVWTPDIILYNDANIDSNNLKYTRVMVESNGNVFWSRPGSINSICDFDLEYYPYDRQTCLLKFGSWTYSENDLVLNQRKYDIDLTYYKENEEWELLDTTSQTNLMKYSCCSESFYDITFTINFKRIPEYYETHILFPAFAISFLNIISIFIPWDSGERISFAITVMLSIIVFLLLVSDDLPRTEQNPLLSRIITVLTIFSFTCLIYIVLLNRLNDYRQKEIEDKKNHNIKSKIIKLFYNFFKKIKYINDDEIKNYEINSEEVDNTRPISYYNAVNKDNRFKIVNNNFLKIIKALNIFYILFFVSFFISICIYLEASSNI